MKTWGGAWASVLGALLWSGCAAAPGQGTQLQVRTAMAASMQQRPASGLRAQPAKQASPKASPLTSACKAGDSRACLELGDKLSLRYAFAEAHAWYALSCKRVSGAMEPTAQRLLLLSQGLTQATSLKSEEGAETAANLQHIRALKDEAIELRSRIQGCFDAGDSLKLEAERKQSLAFYDIVCEFSTLVPAVGEAVPGLEHVTDSGCQAAEALRARLGDKANFQPEMFASLVEGRGTGAAASAEQGMVFGEGDL